MKTSSIAVETSRSTTQSDSIVRQTNKRSSCLLFYYTAEESDHWSKCFVLQEDEVSGTQGMVAWGKGGGDTLLTVREVSLENLKGTNKVPISCLIGVTPGDSMAKYNLAILQFLKVAGAIVLNTFH